MCAALRKVMIFVKDCKKNMNGFLELLESIHIQLKNTMMSGNKELLKMQNIQNV